VQPKPRGVRSGGTRQRFSDADLERYPWLEDYLAEKANICIPRTSTVGSASSHAAPATMTLEDLDDDQLMQVWEELAAKRQEWETLYPIPGDNFGTSVLGGAWTGKFKKQSFDAILCMARGQAVKAWVKKYGMKERRSFALKLYGEECCGVFSVEWCRRQQYFLDIWKEDLDEDYCFTDSDIQGYTESSDFGVVVNAVSYSPAHMEAVREIRSMIPKEPRKSEEAGTG